MNSDKNTVTAIKESAEALAIAHSTLREELDQRKKLGQEIRDHEPVLHEALAGSNSALSLAEAVLQDNVSEQIMEIAVRESAEALKATSAVLEQELENRERLETALAETEADLVSGMQKASEAEAKLNEALEKGL